MWHPIPVGLPTMPVLVYSVTVRNKSAPTQLLLPFTEERTQPGHGVLVDGDVVVAEAIEGPDHGRQAGRVETGVDPGSLLEQCLRAEASGQHVDVGEVAGFGTVEQGDQFAAGQFFETERGSDAACGRWSARGRIDSEVDEQIFDAGDDEAAEGVAVAEPADVPAACTRSVFEGVTGCRHGAATYAGKQIQISRGPLGKALYCEYYSCGSGNLP